MIKAYESAKLQVEGTNYPIKIKLMDKEYEIQEASLQNVVSAIEKTSAWHMDERDYPGCRGLRGCYDIRKTEYAYTSLIARALDRFVFPNEAIGAILHQAPCRNRFGNPERPDVYIVPFNDFYPGNPLALSDVKGNPREFAMADAESSFYSVAGVEEGDRKAFFPVLIGIPCTPDKLELQLHVSVDKKFWKLVIAKGNPSDHALLCTLRAGVHCLLDNKCFETQDPIDHPAPFKDMSKYSILGPGKRTFWNKENNTVYKFYDKHMDKDTIYPNVMRELIDKVKPLSNMNFTPYSEHSRIYELRYTYVEGNHHPSDLKAFIGVVKTLSKMHEQEIVHGDIRLANMIFPENGDSRLIDFDFAGKHEINEYPSEYNYQLRERHREAIPHGLMKLNHDRYSLKRIIEITCVGQRECIRICEKLKDSDYPLEDVVTLLES